MLAVQRAELTTDHQDEEMKPSLLLVLQVLDPADV